MTRILSLLVCFVALAAGPARAQSQNAALSSRIAFFSPSRAFADSADGKAATARLSALEADRAKAAQEKEAALQKLERSLEQSASVLSDAARG
jgi:Skp family chaperone for outer membrane proteins